MANLDGPIQISSEEIQHLRDVVNLVGVDRQVDSDSAPAVAELAGVERDFDNPLLVVRPGHRDPLGGVPGDLRNVVSL
jgi:hypothetical protein